MGGVRSWGGTTLPSVGRAAYGVEPVASGATFACSCETWTPRTSPPATALGFLVGGLLALSIKFLIPDLRGPSSLGWITGLAALFGVVALLVPWSHYPQPRATRVAALRVLLLRVRRCAPGGLRRPSSRCSRSRSCSSGSPNRRAPALAVAPAAAFALVVADRFRFDVRLNSTLMFALPMLVLVGEALALAQTRRTKAEARRPPARRGPYPGPGRRRASGRAARRVTVGRAARRRRGRGPARRSAGIPPPPQPCVLRPPRARGGDAAPRRRARRR